MATDNSVEYDRAGVGHQRGGRIHARTWLIVLLLVTGVASGVTNYLQYKERRLMITQFVVAANQVLEACRASAAPEQPQADHKPYDNADGLGCDFPGTICEKIL